MKIKSDWPLLVVLATLMALISCESSERSSKSGEHKVLAKGELKLESRVIDNAGMFSKDERQKLFDLISQTESKTGSQLAVETVRSLNGGHLEEISLKRANALKIGRDNFADGLLVYISYDDRKIRIEVGRGLEKIITNEIANRIIREQMAPGFRNHKYFAGTSFALIKIDSLIEKNIKKIGYAR